MRKKTLLNAIKKAEDAAFKDAATMRYEESSVCYMIFSYLREALEDKKPYKWK